MRAITFIFLAILISVSALAYLALPSADPDQSYSAVYLSQHSADSVSFSIQNQEGMVKTYAYEVYEVGVAGTKKTACGKVIVPDGSSSLTEVPVLSRRTEIVRIKIPETGQELHYYTGYQHKEWRPFIEPDLPWEKQDPIVRQFYKRITETPKNDHR